MAIAGPVLQLEGVTLRRGGRPVLDDVTVTFPAAAVTAVVGPSGAGKTTILRCLNRLEEPEGGRVLLDGRPISAFPPAVLRRRVGLVAQVPAPFPGTVRDNLAWGLEHPSDVELAGALDAVGLPRDLLRRDARELSVGQAQRMCLARALTRRPEALLLDEPTSALDADSGQVIEDLLGRLAAAGMSIVVVTHDERQAGRVAAVCARLVDGKLSLLNDGPWAGTGSAG